MKLAVSLLVALTGGPALLEPEFGESLPSATMAPGPRPYCPPTAAESSVAIARSYESIRASITRRDPLAAIQSFESLTDRRALQMPRFMFLSGVAAALVGDEAAAVVKFEEALRLDRELKAQSELCVPRSALEDDLVSLTKTRIREQMLGLDRVPVRLGARQKVSVCADDKRLILVDPVGPGIARDPRIFVVESPVGSTIRGDRCVELTHDATVLAAPGGHCFDLFADDDFSALAISFPDRSETAIDLSELQWASGVVLHDQEVSAPGGGWTKSGPPPRSPEDTKPPKLLPSRRALAPTSAGAVCRGGAVAVTRVLDPTLLGGSESPRLLVYADGYVRARIKPRMQHTQVGLWTRRELTAVHPRRPRSRVRLIAAVAGVAGAAALATGLGVYYGVRAAREPGRLSIRF